MTCDDVQRRLSLAADDDGDPGPPRRSEDGAVHGHVASCRRCSSFAETVSGVRHLLRVEGLDGAPDVAGAVVATLAALPAPPAVVTLGDRRGRRGRRGRRAAAAAFVVGCLAGATVVAVGDDGSAPVAAEPLSELVGDAQHRVTSLTARVDVVERGWHRDVPQRTFTGTLLYRAPESLSLALDDTTAYPTPAWRPNDVRLVVDDDRWWVSGRRDCPAVTQPGCAPETPEVVAVEGREPFADSTAVPLELVTPVASFTLAEGSATLGARTVAGRRALGTTTTAAQVSDLLGGLRPAGNQRTVHPSDTVELWLDAEALVPLALTVRAADSPDRERWAANRGYYDDDPGEAVLDVRLAEVTLNAGVPAGSFPAAPAGSETTDGGFDDDEGAGSGETRGLEPVNLPRALRPHRSGTVGTDTAAGGSGLVSVRTWTDGRAWLKVRSTTSWGGGHLFGELGPLVRPVDLAGAGVAYVSEGGGRVGVHGGDVDVVVSGSLDPADLREVAAGLGVTGLAVPPSWAEAATTTVAAVLDDRPELLVPPPPAGFAAPAARRDGDVVTLAFTGPGDRGFLVVADTTATLLPPTDPDVVGVRVRGGDGRWNPGPGALEWVEAGTSYALRSQTLTLGELLGIAASMEPER